MRENKEIEKVGIRKRKGKVTWDREN